MRSGVDDAEFWRRVEVRDVRKLNGDIPVTADECQALAYALGITLVWPKRRRAT